MRICVVIGSVLLLAFASIGAGGPVTGGWFDELKIGSKSWTDTKRFRANERASVLVRGNANSKSAMQISVYDSKGTLVVEEKGKFPPVADMLAVFWYPPREAEYKIEIKNLGTGENSCYVTIK
jgi:hypothetical protein